MSVFETAIGWLAPPQCIVCGDEGFTLCESCSANKITPFGERCWHCSGITKFGRTCEKCRSIGGPRHVWISTTYEDTAAGLIRAYKFDQQRVAVQPLTRLMCQSILRIHNRRSLAQFDYLVVPVPTATMRARQRSFDHADLLAKAVARRLSLHKTKALGRLGQSRQLGALREQRLKQLSNQIYVRRTDVIKGRNILLIDDVITTGGTLIAATKALRQAGASHVDALVFAKKL